MKKISLFLISIFILYGCGNNSPTTSEESPLLPNIKKYKLDEENSLSSNNQQYKLDAEGSLSPKPGKYNFVIYKDSTGDFFAPNGGRICSIESIKTDKYELLNHKKEWLQIYLSREMKFLDSYSCFIR